MKIIIVKAWDDGSPWDGLFFAPHFPSWTLSAPLSSSPPLLIAHHPSWPLASPSWPLLGPSPPLGPLTVPHDPLRRSSWLLAAPIGDPPALMDPRHPY